MVCSCWYVYVEPVWNLKETGNNLRNVMTNFEKEMTNFHILYHPAVLKKFDYTNHRIQTFIPKLIYAALFCYQRHLQGHNYSCTNRCRFCIIQHNNG
jgi:hypothetical protein